MKFISKEEFKPTRKKWPFNELEVGKGIELPDGFNDCDVKKIAVAARTYEAKSNVSFQVATVKKADGTKAVQVLRAK